MPFAPGAIARHMLGQAQAHQVERRLVPAGDQVQHRVQGLAMVARNDEAAEPGRISLGTRQQLLRLHQPPLPEQVPGLGHVGVDAKGQRPLAQHLHGAPVPAVHHGRHAGAADLARRRRAGVPGLQRRRLQQFGDEGVEQRRDGIEAAALQRMPGAAQQRQAAQLAAQREGVEVAQQRLGLVEAALRDQQDAAVRARGAQPGLVAACLEQHLGAAQVPFGLLGLPQHPQRQRLHAVQLGVGVGKGGVEAARQVQQALCAEWFISSGAVGQQQLGGALGAAGGQQQALAAQRIGLQHGGALQQLAVQFGLLLAQALLQHVAEQLVQPQRVRRQVDDGDEQGQPLHLRQPAGGVGCPRPGPGSAPRPARAARCCAAGSRAARAPAGPAPRRRGSRRWRGRWPPAGAGLHPGPGAARPASPGSARTARPRRCRPGPQPGQAAPPRRAPAPARPGPGRPAHRRRAAAPAAACGFVAGRQHQPPALAHARQPAVQELQRGRVDEVVGVVQHDEAALDLAGLQRVQHRVGHGDDLGAAAQRRVAQALGRRAPGRVIGLEGGEQAVQQPAEVVALVQRHPGDGAVLGHIGQGLGQQRRLAVAGGARTAAARGGHPARAARQPAAPGAAAAGRHAGAAHGSWCGREPWARMIGKPPGLEGIARALPLTIA